MKFKKLKIKGAFIINHSLYNDDRGRFGREFCYQIFNKYLRLNNKFKVLQTNISFNKKSRTLRGFHYQIGKSAETKVISVYEGEIYDVILDLSKNSKTFKKWIGFKINSKKLQSIIVPKGCANAFITLKNNTIVHYITNKKYNKKLERGMRYDDPEFKIKWPQIPKHISKKDLSWKFYNI